MMGRYTLLSLCMYYTLDRVVEGCYIIMVQVSIKGMAQVCPIDT